MDINKEQIENFIEQTINQNKLKKRGNNIYLTDYQIDILKKYNIDYENCSNISELIFMIETYLNNHYDTDYNDLELISQSLSELNYYNNINK